MSKPKKLRQEISAAIEEVTSIYSVFLMRTSRDGDSAAVLTNATVQLMTRDYPEEIMIIGGEHLRPGMMTMGENNRGRVVSAIGPRSELQVELTYLDGDSTYHYTCHPIKVKGRAGRPLIYPTD